VLIDGRQSNVTSSYGVVTSHPVCRDRLGAVDVDTFSRRACALCFSYLFPRAAYAAEPPQWFRLVPVNRSGRVHGAPIPVGNPDVDSNFTQKVCSLVGE